MLYITLLHISHFSFFANDLLPAVYFIFVLDYGNDVRQKANLSDFLFEFKMSGKVVETTCNINNSFDPGTANEGTVQWWSQKFSRGDENLEDKEHDGRPSKLTTTD